MAAKKDSLEDLIQEVTCPLCLDTFEDPRVLPCQHVYCKSCLDLLATRSNGAFLCPECRKGPILASDVAGLSVAFQVNRLKEVVAKMTLEEESKATGSVATDGPMTGEVKQQGSSSTCPYHPSQTRDLYCRQCQQLVCRDCILFGKNHVDHQYDKVEAVTTEFRHDVESQLASLLQKQPAVKQVTVDLQKARKVTEEKREVVSGKISESYDRFLRVVEEKKEHELRRFQNDADSKLLVIADHEAAVLGILSEMKAVTSLVQQEVGCLNDAEFMLRKREMVFKINKLLQRVDKISLEFPSTDLSAQVVNIKSAEASLCLTPYNVVDPFQCHVTEIKKIQVGVVMKAVIWLNDSGGQPCPVQQHVTAELHGPRFGGVIATVVTPQSSSCYQMSCMPTLVTRGHCKLVVKVGSHVIGGRGIEVVIECPPQFLGDPVHFIYIEQPATLKILEEKMFCRVKSAKIMIIDLGNTAAPPTHSAFVPKHKKLTKWSPGEMAIDKELNLLYVGDPYNNMVHKFRLNGDYITSIGEKGSGKGQFNCVNGLCVSGDGTLYVCDSNNHRIQVFDHDLWFVRYIGSYGTAAGQFNWPDTVAFDNSGCLIMTDYNNHRIQRLNSQQGHPIHCFGREGRGPGQLEKPNIILVAGNHFFLTDKHKVSVFNIYGEFVSQFGSMCSTSELDGLAVDKHGFVFVSDRTNNRIVVF